MSGAPELIVIGGPNGAGKSTYAQEFLKSRPLPFLSADSIAARLSPAKPSAARIAAGRKFIAEVDIHLAQRTSFSIEVTLAGRRARNLLERARRAGYEIELVFIFVDSPETSLARIRERVRKGGHHVPEKDVRRRFDRSLRNFWTDYRFRVDQWYVCYNALGNFRDVAVGSGNNIVVRDPVQLQKLVEVVES